MYKVEAKTYIHKTKIEIEKKSNHTTLIKDFFITFILALTNPVTILAFLAIFAGLGVPKGEVNSILLVSGVFIGSALWWLLLCEFVTIFRKKIEEKMMVWLNRGAGLIIFGFGVTALILAFYEKGPF
ncbi:MAG: hypothetical protein KR126chlam3_00858 [Chlamydiae bacterium]|nr:hypothetical protein [Chlamydiota bacterium]